MVTLIVVLAIYVSFGRLLMSNVAQYGADILQELNARLPFTVEADAVSGEWHSFTPEIVFTGLKLRVHGSASPPIELAEGRIALDVLESLRTRSPRISKLSLDALDLHGELSADGKLTIAGLGGGGGELTEWLEQLLLNIESVDLGNNTLMLTLPDGQLRLLQLDFALRRNGSKRRLAAKIFSPSTGAMISARAEGMGNPLNAEAFVGELYLNVDMADLGAFQRLLNQPFPVVVEGELDAEVWLAWDKGVATLEVDLVGRELNFAAADQSWELPADWISMQASLVERDDQWSVFASDFQFRKGDIHLRLPRLQLENWGDSLRIRAADVPMAAINALLVDLSVTPEVIADVFEVLQTRGELTALQLDIADLRVPGEDWQLAANFRGLEVDSWRGAPGITAAKGFVELAPTGGYVVLDSQAFSMNFPKVYKHPLSYQDVFGTINIDWSADALNLSSGLMTVSGEEGVAHVLFGLNIPLVKNDVGLEMDLLVGLEDFHPKYRSKYLPYILSDALLDWLQPSIGEGRIEQGAFLWRGSLRPNTPALKTVQLFFNVADVQLNYHPDWPPVSDLYGTVYIDDTNVSVWAERASLYDSTVNYLSVETWLNASKKMVLAIDGALSGDAADGLRIVNNSPLTEIVGPVFADWQVQGQLQTEMQLQLVLGDSTQKPDIHVKTLWQDIDLTIEPGNITMLGVDGQLSYSSARGFTSKDLTGELWGRPVTAQVRQRQLPGPTVDGEQRVDGTGLADSVLEVAVVTRVDMADVRQWLDLDMLAFAEGETDADIRIRVPPGQGALLSVQSSLLGVELKLPEPWGKSARQRAPLSIELPLGGDTSQLELELDSALHLHMQLSEGRFAGAALSFYEPPSPVEDGAIRVSGHTPVLDVDQWQAFIGDYIEDGVLAGGADLVVTIDTLGADTLLLMGQDFRDVVFSLEAGSGKWDISAETSWLAGRLQIGAEGESMELAIHSLDLDKMDHLNLAGLDTGEPLKLPDMSVSLQGLRWGGHLLGGLEFTLLSDDDALIAENITGSVAGLVIDAERPAQLRWQQGPTENKTNLEAIFGFHDLGATLEQLGYQRVLESEEGQFSIALEWPGGPQSFSLRDAQGSTRIAIGKGQFLSAPSGATGALRVVSILNLAEIISRLSLSHMFESGIPFYTIEGEMFLFDGEFEVANMEVEGSSSSFQFSGVGNVESHSLEGNLVVTLPVANNLPWVVALAAGLPVAAGVFVVSKVFKKQMNRFSSGVYRVSGTWDDPQVDFVRIFTDTPAAASRSEPADTPSQRVDSNSPVTETELPAPAELPVQSSAADPS